MPHWDEVQVGDTIQWNDSDDAFQIIAKVKEDDWWRVDFKSLQTNHIYKNDPRQGFFTYARIITTKSIQEKVIAKIKYLNLRYQNRHQHV